MADNRDQHFARIPVPDGGELDEEALRHYNEAIQAIAPANVEVYPMVESPRVAFRSGRPQPEPAQPRVYLTDRTARESRGAQTDSVDLVAQGSASGPSTSGAQDPKVTTPKSRSSDRLKGMKPGGSREESPAKEK